LKETITIRQGIRLSAERPYVLCIDVGGPAKIGWANSEGKVGSGEDLGDALEHLSQYLLEGGNVALGFEAPIWTPVRTELARITARRGGVETTYNRAWSAGAGSGALGAALALMPWCLTRVANVVGRSAAVTVDVKRFQERGGLLLWEAFVSGAMKAVEIKHHEDARLACHAFLARWPNLASDIPGERAVNHAVSSAIAAGLSIDLSELQLPALVVGVALKTATETTTGQIRG
jgi:hypothetical protein